MLLNSIAVQKRVPVLKMAINRNGNQSSSVSVVRGRP